MMTCRDCKWAECCIMSAPDGGWEVCSEFKERDMDEKDKTINELRRSTTDLLHRIQELQQNLREDWHVWDEAPEDDEAVLALWLAEKNGREQYYYALLIYTEEDGWELNDIMQSYKKDGHKVEVVAWKELPDRDLLTAQLFED